MVRRAAGLALLLVCAGVELLFVAAMGSFAWSIDRTVVVIVLGAHAVALVIALVLAGMVLVSSKRGAT